MDPGKSAVGVRNFSHSESFFMDHFPGYPLVPGVLHIEMIAQLGAMCVLATHQDSMPILGSVKSAKFYKKIVPGDQAVIKVNVTVRKDFSVLSGHIEVEGKKVSAAEVILAHIPKPEKLTAKSLKDGILGEWMRLRVNESSNME